MKIMNWESIEESTPYEKLPAGGYVARIVDIEDKADRQYLNIVYDIAEGDYTGFYGDEFGTRNSWAHRFVRSYKDTAQGMFKAFLCRLEESNPGFSVTSWQQHCNERELIGLLIGIVVQLEDYTNDQGEDRERLQVVSLYAADSIRNGDYKLPDRKDSRKAIPTELDDIPIPFDMGPAAARDKATPTSDNLSYNDLPFMTSGY